MHTPEALSSMTNMETQIVFKLGTIETAVQSLKDNVENSFRRLERKIDDTSRKAEIDNAKLEVKVEHSENKIDSLEQWKNGMNTRIGAVVAAVSAFWLLLGKPIETMIGTLF